MERRGIVAESPVVGKCRVARAGSSPRNGSIAVAKSDTVFRVPRGLMPRSKVLALVGEFWSFLRVRKKWWLAPIVIIMLLFGSLIVLTHGSALAPFIYTVF
jgi:hypothetical protein